jgi:hypothetical protein
MPFEKNSESEKVYVCYSCNSGTNLCNHKMHDKMSL